MSLKRTQVYFEPEQHRLLKKEAALQGISLAEFLRRMVREYLRKEPTRKDFFKIVGMGKSGRSDISEKHDYYTAESISSG